MRYVSDEGQSFFGDIYDMKTLHVNASIEAMDEKCELYMLDSSKRAKLKDNDMAKRIHEILNMTNAEKESFQSNNPARQTFFFEDGI